MSRRAVWRAVGIAVGCVAVLAALTVIPVAHSQHRRADNELAGKDVMVGGACDGAAVEFDTTIDYTVTRPVLDLWGFARAIDITVKKAVLNVTAQEECDTSAVTVVSTAWLAHPSCDQSEWQGDPIATSREEGIADACEGQALFYSATVPPGEKTGGIDAALDSQLKPSGLARGQWCLGSGGENRFSSAAGESAAATSTTPADICLDLS